MKEKAKVDFTTCAPCLKSRDEFLKYGVQHRTMTHKSGNLAFNVT